MSFLFKRLDHWYQGTPGQYLFESERASLQQVLPRLFGYHLLQIGGPATHSFIDSSPIIHKIRMDHELISDFKGDSVLSNFDQLPFLPDSIDLVLLPHVLEFIEEPKALLEQVYYTLMPEGHIILLGFNPTSLWGLFKLCTHKKSVPWMSEFISAYRVKHWLSQVGYILVEDKSVFFRPPITRKKVLQKLLFMEAIGQLIWPYLGASYMIIAKKRVTPLTKIRSPLQEKVPVHERYLEPTSRA